MTGLQGSLLDDHATLRVEPLAGHIQRRVLDARSWLDVRPGWVTGSDQLFDALATGVAWRAERRPMYDAVVDVPRLVSFYGEHDLLPHRLLTECRERLTEHYRDELGEPFRTCGMCLYRDGADSVAWHGDRIGRSRSQDTMVAILSIGSPRTLALRPNGGRTALRIGLGHGDLVVMGGACQREWEHCVPKTSKPVGPRMSIQFRVRGVL